MRDLSQSQSRLHRSMPTPSENQQTLGVGMSERLREEGGGRKEQETGSPGGDQ